MKSVRIKKPQLMPVSSTDPLVLQQTINKLVEAMQPLVGQVTNKLERAVTFEDLRDGGFDVGAFTSGGSGAIIVPQPPAGKPDMSVPPVVTGFAAVANWELAILSWDASKYRNHAYVEIYRATGFKDDANEVPTTILDAVYIGQSNTTVMTDHVVSNHHYRYWARNVSTQGVVSEWDSQQGTVVFAPRSPKEYISIISGEIKKDDLYKSLGEEIDKIPVLDAGLADAFAGINANSASITQNSQSINSLSANSVAQSQLIAANTSSISTLNQTVQSNSAAILQNSSAVTDLQQSQATTTEQVAALTLVTNSLGQTVQSNSANIAQQSVAITNLEQSQATLTQQVNAVTTTTDSLGQTVSSNTATITQQSTAITNLQQSQATLTQQVSANSTTIQQNFQVTTQQGQLINAAYTLKIDTGDCVSGFGLMTDATGKSRFAIRADRFYIAPPSRTLDSLDDSDIPFIVNGSDTLIKNAYIDTAYIQTLVTGSLIATKITGQTITGVHIVGGDLTIGNNFTVDGQGNLVATNAFLSGQIQASSGVLNNVQINENCNILGTLTAKQIRGDVVNFKRVDCPANGKWYSEVLTGSPITLVPTRKIATFTLESWATPRHFITTNFLLGIGSFVYEVGSAFSARIEARLANGTVIKTWYVVVLAGQYPGALELIVGKKVQVGTQSITTRVLEFDVPAGQTKVEFWFVPTTISNSGNGITKLEIFAGISNIDAMSSGDTNPNFYGAFADIQYMSTGYSSGVVIT